MLDMNNAARIGPMLTAPGRPTEKGKPKVITKQHNGQDRDRSAKRISHHV